MILWTRRTPPDFAEVLAEVARVKPSRSSDPVEATPTDDEQAGGGDAISGIVPDAAAQSRNRLGRALAGLSWPRPSSGANHAKRAAAAYEQDAADLRSTEEPAPVEPRTLAPRPPKTEDEVIAEELGLTRPLAKADLERLRREFAKRNHPDRCAPAQRPRAARRMSIANMLIDAELKQKQRPG